jgi:hypothetical protein
MIQGVASTNTITKAEPVTTESPEKPVPEPVRPSVSPFIPAEVRKPTAAKTEPSVVIPERQIIRYSIRLLTPRLVFFSDRNYYGVGDVIMSGPLKGEQILKIDYARRKVTTSKREFVLGDVIEQVKTPAIVTAEDEKEEPECGIQ